MPISLNVNRPKLSETVTVPISIINKPVVENVTDFDIPICFDNLTTTPVVLSDITFASGSNTITGLSVELAKVKIGSVIVTADTTTDFASGTYVTAKPTPTTLTVSTNSLAAKTNTTGTATLTVDATACIFRIKPVINNTSVRFDVTVSRFNGSLATDSNGNGYDEVTYSQGETFSLSGINIDFDTFATNFGLARVNA